MTDEMVSAPGPPRPLSPPPYASCALLPPPPPPPPPPLLLLPSFMLVSASVGVLVDLSVRIYVSLASTFSARLSGVRVEGGFGSSGGTIPVL
jgi:hypothetical protein